MAEWHSIDMYTHHLVKLIEDRSSSTRQGKCLDSKVATQVDTESASARLTKPLILLYWSQKKGTKSRTEVKNVKLFVFLLIIIIWCIP